MKRVRWLILIPVILGLLTLWVVNCSGPRPSASDLRVQPPPAPGQEYTLSAVVHNNGSGHGAVDVTFALKDKGTGRTYSQTQSVTLDPGEEAVVSAQIRAPLGQYTPQVDLAYPIGSPGSPGLP
jgi:hypothetical protein